ncbi:SDR family NAD(P)-dependent oxidoreductase [Dyadobacter psychrotolerans]|uniref:SDR family NAD(P)-dependent oxidoreductase n=1 Tax=Dyadobacter psychrotolerans TaxID=2541721 RepID=A0A4V2Z4V5_9BACT|nr:SDR family NAD(P)-dependent oxidoreductase [Dyadobacter psychrotolerans]TDE16828.1 SDR family NAD(P)-dependent oxidoreductase [Dyadobacter psychrotolerans]
MKKNIIISGASGNLGKDVVQKLSDLNHQLYVTTGSHHADLFDGFPNVDAQALDLLNKDVSETFVTESITKAKHIQAGIFLVGGYAPGGLEETEDDAIEKMIHLNFFTAFHLVKPLVNHFQANGGGQLIFIGAKPALIAKQGAGNFAYALSKSLLFKMAEMINAEYESNGITATMIVPGTIDTPPNREAMPYADFDKWISASDIAESIAFVLSDTGQKLRQTVIKIYNQS